MGDNYGYYNGQGGGGYTGYDAVDYKDYNGETDGNYYDNSETSSSYADSYFNRAYNNEEWGCCNDAQTNFLLLYFAFCLLAVNLWKTLLTKPIEVVNRFVHEGCHAFMTWLTGGQVLTEEEEIQEEREMMARRPRVVGTPLQQQNQDNCEEGYREVTLVVGTRLKQHKKMYSNLKSTGGVSQYRNGIRFLIIPGTKKSKGFCWLRIVNVSAARLLTRSAHEKILHLFIFVTAGYIGSSVFPMVLVILSGGRHTATAVAGIMVAALLLSLAAIPDPFVVAVAMIHAFVITGATYIEWYVYAPILQFLVLFYGVCSFVFVLVDISEDSNPRRRSEADASDAHACFRESFHCCLPNLVALAWKLWAITLQLIAIWIAMAEMSDECSGKRWLECAISSTGYVDAWDGLKFSGFWQQVSSNNYTSYFGV